MNAFLTKPVTLEKIHAALSSATSVQRAAPSFHLADQTQPVDPAASLRLLAQRKGVPIETEIALFFTELASEDRLLTDALERREPAVASDAAHRLVGRLAFIHALVEVQLAREIEASSMNEFWDQADASAARLANLLPGLRDRITAAG